jgi:magnesium transporter
MRAHPAEAARALEAVPVAEVAGLLARAPARLGGPVLASMLPAAATRTIDALDDERAMELLGVLPIQPAAALLIHVAEPRRSQLIAGLPTAMALASRLLLGYPADSVGLWADPEVIAVAPDATAGAALERVRHGQGEAGLAFVVEADQRLVGWLGLPALLRAPESARLETLMLRPDAMLAAQTPLDGALAHPGWRLHSALPVVERGDRLLGVLTHDALVRALRRDRLQQGADMPQSLAGVLTRGYWSTLSGGLAAALMLLPAEPPVAGSRDGR